MIKALEQCGGLNTLWKIDNILNMCVMKKTHLIFRKNY